MRDTNKHPITQDEMADACDRAAAAKVREYAAAGTVGDIDAAALTLAAALLRELANKGQP